RLRQPFLPIAAGVEPTLPSAPARLGYCRPAPLPSLLPAPPQPQHFVGPPELHADCPAHTPAPPSPLFQHLRPTPIPHHHATPARRAAMAAPRQPASGPCAAGTTSGGSAKRTSVCRRRTSGPTG